MARGKGRNTHRSYKGGGSSTGASGGQKRRPLTHFLCLPLVTSSSRVQLEQSFQRLREAVSGDAGGSTGKSSIGSEDGVEASLPILPAKAVRPVGTVHLTLGVMSLESHNRVQGAIELLRSLDPRNLIEEGIQQAEIDTVKQSQEDTDSVLGTQTPKATTSAVAKAPSSSASADIPLNTLRRPVSPPPLSREPSTSSPKQSQGPVIICLRSLVSMHPSTKTSILYAAPRDPTHRLLPLCQRLRAVFEEKEYLIEDTRPLKLHATIVNTIYAKAGGRYGRGKPAAAQILAPEPNLTPVDVPEDATESVEEPEPAEREDEVKASSKPDDHRNRHDQHSRAPIRFDARALMKVFDDFVWAKEVKLEKIAICKMGAKKVLGENGDIVDEVYEEVASIPLL